MKTSYFKLDTEVINLAGEINTSEIPFLEKEVSEREDMLAVRESCLKEQGKFEAVDKLIKDVRNIVSENIQMSAQVTVSPYEISTTACPIRECSEDDIDLKLVAVRDKIGAHKEVEIVSVANEAQFLSSIHLNLGVFRSQIANIQMRTEIQNGGDVAASKARSCLLSMEAQISTRTKWLLDRLNKLTITM